MTTVRTLLAVGSVLAAAGAAAWSHVLAFETTPIRVGRSEIQNGAALESSDPVPLVEGIDVFARPLFRPDRRPYQKPVVVEEEVQTSVEADIARDFEDAPRATSFRVLGIARVSGRAAALLTASPDMEPRWVATGETFETWTIHSIDRDHVRLMPPDSRDLSKAVDARVDDLAGEEVLQ